MGRREFDLSVVIGGRVDNSLSSSIKDVNRHLDGMKSGIKKAAGIAATAFSTVKIGDFLGDAVDQAKEFETSMAGVAKVVDGLKSPTGELTGEYYDMKDAIINMSKEMPTSADGIAEIMEAAGQANIAKEDLTQFTESAVKMGIAFDTTAEQSGAWMAQWRTSLKLSQNEVETLADKINYLGNTSSEDANKLSEIVTRIGSLADISGVSGDQVAALGAAMTGVKADVSATGIKNFLNTLSAGSSATKSQAEAYKKLGLSAEDVAKSMQKNSEDTMLHVLEQINSLDRTEQSSVITKLFGKESKAAISPLISNLDNLKEQFNKIGDAAQYAGSMEEEFKTASSTSANLDIITDNKYAAMKEEIGSTLMPLADEMNKVKGQVFGIVEDFVSDNSHEIGEWIENTVEFVEENLPNVITFLKDLGGTIADFSAPFLSVGGWLIENPDVIKDVLATVLAFKGASKVGGIVTDIGKGIGGLIKNARGAGSVGSFLNIFTNPKTAIISGAAGAISLVASAVHEANEAAKDKSLSDHFGDISLSLQDIDEVAGHIIGENKLGKLTQGVKELDELDDLEEKFRDLSAELDKTEWKVSIGIKLDKNAKKQYKKDIKQFTKEIQDAELQKQYTSTMSLDMLGIDGKAGKKMRKQLDNFYQNNSKELKDLGKQLNKAVNKGWQDGLLDMDEIEKIQQIREEMTAVEAGVEMSEFKASLTVLEGHINGKALTPEAYENLIKEVDEKGQVAIDAYEKMLQTSIMNQDSMYAEGSISKEEYDANMLELKRGFLDKKTEVTQAKAEFQLNTIESAYPELAKAKEGLKKEFESDINYFANTDFADNGKALNDMLYKWGNTDFADLEGSLSKGDRLAVEELNQLFLPTFDELQAERQQYEEIAKEAGKDIGEVIPESLLDGINEASETYAVTGDTRGIENIATAMLGKANLSKDKLDTILNSEVLTEEGATIPNSFAMGIEENKKIAEDKMDEFKKTTQDIIDKNLSNGFEKEFDVKLDANLKANVPLATFSVSLTAGATTGFSGSTAEHEREKGMAKLPGHAYGGRIGRPTVSKFAEIWPEYAIPINGSNRSKDLWISAGKELGMIRTASEPHYATSQNSNSFTTKIEVNIAGDASSKQVKQAAKMTEKEFSAMLERIQRKQMRGSFAYAR